MKQLMLASVLLCLLSPSLVAAELATSAASPMKPDAPRYYTVQQGDTLWGIAERFLKNPWVWREVWQANSQIESPHLLFPGDEIGLIQHNGLPKLTVTRRGVASRTIKLSPRVRVSPIESAIPTIPINAITAFLNRSRLLTFENELDRAPYVVALRNQRLLAGTGDTIHVRGYFVGASGQYEIVRAGAVIKDPQTNAVLGMIGDTVADVALVEASSAQLARFKVLTARREIKAQDRVLARETMMPVTTFHPKASTMAISSKIVGTLNQGKAIGLYDTVIINAGHQYGLEQGDVLIIRQQAKAEDSRAKTMVPLPLENIGTVMVYRPFATLSYGIVMSATEDIRVGDLLDSP